MAAIQGERIPGGFILITGLDGIRYAVRRQSVGIIGRIALKICEAMARRESDIALAIRHWPRRVFARSQRWCATLNS